MRRLPLAARLRVRTACDVGWDAMEELGTHRWCARCESTVHDVASLTRAEAETLLEARERGERVCLHLHVRKSDGAVLVADGHVEREPVRRAPPSRMVAAAVATATALTACSPATAPKAPATEIAIAPPSESVPPIETAPPPAPPSDPTPPPPAAPPPLPVEPTDPPPPAAVQPVRPTKTTSKPAAKSPKKIATPPPQKPKHAPKDYDQIDGGAF